MSPVFSVPNNTSRTSRPRIARHGGFFAAVFGAVLCVVLGTFVATAPARAANAPNVTEPGLVNCGTTPIRLAFYDYGLFHFQRKETGTTAGIDKDIVDELVKRTGCRFSTQVMARARIWTDLQSGQLDMSVSGIQTPERDTFAFFAHYLVMKNFAIVRADIAPKLNRADDFIHRSSLKFGAVQAFKHGAEQDRLLSALRGQQRVEDSPDAETLFRKLRDRRIDAIFSQPPVYRKLLRDLDMASMVDDVQDWTPDETGVPHGLILAKSRFSEADAAKWSKIIQEMRNDGTLRRIFGRYLSASESVRLLSLQ